MHERAAWPSACLSLICAVIAGLAGCSTSDSNGTSSAPDAAPTCSGLDEASCSSDDCRAIRAYLIGEDAGRPLTFIACVRDDSCTDGDAVTCAQNDETGAFADFTTTCVPPGWSSRPDGCANELEDGGAR